jgi:predicted nucleic acid-binding protein
LGFPKFVPFQQSSLHSVIVPRGGVPKPPGSELVRPARRRRTCSAQKAPLESALMNRLSLSRNKILTELRRRFALAIAINLNHPIYDCFYLALAQRERCAIITADAKLLAAAKKMKAKARLL